MIEQKIILKLQQYCSLIPFGHFFTSLFSINTVMPYLLLDWDMDIFYKFFIGFSIILVYIIKNILKRERPYQSNENIKKLDLNLEEAFLSFPSSHSMVTKMLCLYWFYIEYKNEITPLILLVPYFVGIARCVLGMHYPTDVIGGLIIGECMYGFYNTIK